jgi:hypothetical protein
MTSNVLRNARQLKDSTDFCQQRRKRPNLIAEDFRLTVMPDLRPQYHIARTQMPVILQPEDPEEC